MNCHAALAAALLVAATVGAAQSADAQTSSVDLTFAVRAIDQAPVDSLSLVVSLDGTSAFAVYEPDLAYYKFAGVIAEGAPGSVEVEIRPPSAFVGRVVRFQDQAPQPTLGAYVLRLFVVPTDLPTGFDEVYEAGRGLVGKSPFDRPVAFFRFAYDRLNKSLPPSGTSPFS